MFRRHNRSQFIIIIKTITNTMENKSHKHTQSLTPEQSEFIRLFPANSWNIGRTMEAIGMSRRTYYEWLDNNELFKQTIEDFKEDLVDIAEQTMIRAMERENSVDAAKFMLKYLGRKRGYTDRTEIDITSGNKPITINIIKPDDV